MTEKNKKKKTTAPLGEEPAAPAAGQNPESNAAQGAASSGDAVPAAPMVALPMEEYEALQKAAEHARTQTSEYFEGWQRERADFANYKRRVEREASQTYQNALGNVVKKYLVIVDDLERALKARPTSGEGSAWFEGVELIYRKLVNLLDVEGVKQMDAIHEQFDPSRHEAIMQQDSPDHKSGQIIEVIQPGYLLGDRVIRPALVRVAR
jgi:molecular chaperone GrpE